MTMWFYSPEQARFEAWAGLDRCTGWNYPERDVIDELWSEYENLLLDEAAANRDDDPYREDEITEALDDAFAAMTEGDLR
jgi:hypothetical protein